MNESVRIRAAAPTEAVFLRLFMASRPDAIMLERCNDRTAVFTVPTNRRTWFVGLCKAREIAVSEETVK